MNIVSYNILPDRMLSAHSNEKLALQVKHLLTTHLHNGSSITKINGSSITKKHQIIPQSHTVPLNVLTEYKLCRT